VLLITDGTGDGDMTTDTRGRGVIWDGTSRLWCNTSAAGVSAEYDITLLTLNPDLQWAGGDVTWQGSHGFAGDVSMDSTLALSGKISSISDLSITGGAIFMDTSADLGGPVDISQALTCASNATITGGIFVDGTSNVTGDVRFSGDISFNASAADGTAMMINATDGYRIIDVQGTNQVVYTKYLTGTLDNDTSTTFAHGVTAGATKILCAHAIVWNGTSSQWTAQEWKRTAGGNAVFECNINNANVVFNPVGTDFQGQIYRIKIDYVL